MAADSFPVVTGRQVAAFDFDGTITRRDTLVPFLRQVRGGPRFTSATAAAAPALARGGREAFKVALLRRLLAVKGYAHVSTTMNQASGGIYERNGGYPIARTDRELLGVLRWPPLVEEVLLRRNVAPTLARAASRLAALRPLLETLARATSALRTADWNPDPSGDSAIPPAPDVR